MFAIDQDMQPSSRAPQSGKRRRAVDVRFSEQPLTFALGLLRRHAAPVLLCTMVGGAVAAGLALMTHNRYSATTQLLIDPRELRVMQNEVSPQGTSNDAAITYLESQVRVLTSDSIKRKVIERLSLAGDPDFGGAGKGLAERLGLTLSDGGEGRDPVLMALAAMDKQVLVRRNERTFVIDITTISGDGEKSARVSNQMAETYIEDQAQVRAEISQRASNALSGRLNELRERVRAAEAKVETYRAANNLVGAGGKLVTEESLAVSNTQLTQARARTADAQAKFDQVRIVRPSSVEAGATPEALQSPAIASLRAQLGAALTREADALVLYGAQHPLLISAQAQVRDARRQIAEELARIVQAARAELDRARASEAAISQQVERLKRETLSTGQAGVQLRELEREADAHRQVYQAFLLRARETGELTSVDTTNARVITPAVAPLEKMGPNRKLYVIAGLAAGFAFGLALALLRELLASGRLRLTGAREENGQPAAMAQPEPSRQRAPAETGRPTADPASQRPAFAGLRSMVGQPAATSATGAGQARGTRWRGAADADFARDGSQGPDPVLRLTLPGIPVSGRGRRAVSGASAFHGTAFLTDAWDNTASPLAATLRAVRDRLALEEVPGTNRKVAVLGLTPGAGASLVALNLALTHASETATALLVDMAGGPLSLTAGFAGDAEIGAEDVIDGSAGLIRAALQDVETGAFFLPRPRGGERKPAPEPARLKSGLFDQARRFDAVVIDAGSLSDGALPHLLAELADDIVLVAPALMDRHCDPAMLQRAFGSDAAKVRVVIINQGAPA